MEDRAREDQRVVESVLAGDGNAYRELVLRYQGLVAGIAWRFGVHRGEVEDVVSEVFLKAYRNLRQYRPDHPFSTWLYRLAANHLVDRARRARKERGRVELPADLTDRAPRPGERMEQQERAELLRRALGRLNPRYREVLALVYAEGMKVEDVARLLGIPDGTVKTRLMRGRAALREALARRHPEHFGARHAVP